MLNFIYPTASLRVVGGGEGVWESDSLSSPSPENRSWGQSGGRERSKLAQEGEWGTWLALQQPWSRMQGWRLQRTEGNSSGREWRCSSKQKHGKAPRERTEGRLEKGQKLDATLERGANLEINTHTRTPTHPPSCQNCYPRSVLAWTIQKGSIWFAMRGKSFPSFLLFFTGMEQKFLWILAQKEKTNSPCVHIKPK